MQDRLTALCDLAIRHADAPAAASIPRVGFHVAQEAAATASPVLYRPMVVMVLQGAKRVLIGERELRYDTASYFVGSVDLPASSCIIEASTGTPYVAVSLALDQQCLADLMAGNPGAASRETMGFAVSPVTPQLLDAWSRLIGLLDTPADIPVLAPLAEREILYRVLQGPQGDLIRQAARVEGRLAQVRQAIEWIRTNFDRPLRTEILAEVAGMSVASLHRHFRKATAMSPLQYQKALRLQEARRLLIAQSDAARAGFAVGYESASQFSREYTRMFGAPPARDAVRLRQAEIFADEVA
ncbi:AraC family transcriptional regulator [Novosphingobium sp. BL-8H]|uniref:AraC family transcriptional regulator n=1 Tax=Novosphingobium sp. BL-8H TaxID=3127640 RepID=UPI0037583C42